MFIHTFNLLTKVLCFPLAPPLLSWLPPSCPITSSSSSRCQPANPLTDLSYQTAARILAASSVDALYVMRDLSQNFPTEAM